MRPNHINYQRLEFLEEILEILYVKLGEYQKEIACTASIPIKTELKHKMKKDIIPDIQKYEKEYGEIIAPELQEVFVVSEVQANNVIVQVNKAIKHIEEIPPERYPDPEQLKALLNKLDQIINDPDPGKTAQAKLKLALPIIPLLASYELEMDTEAFLVNVWRGIKSMVRRKA
jgi:hypothetical protein